MGNYMVLFVGAIVSNLINSIILFQFIEERYNRIYDSRLLYKGVRILTCCVMSGINLFNHPAVNLIGWIVAFSLINTKMYENVGKKISNRIFEIVVLILVLTICETVGVVIFEFVLWKTGIYSIQPAMRSSFNMTFSKLVVLFFYYTVIIKLWREDAPVKFTPAQYFVHAIIIVYSLANLAVIVTVITKVTSKSERILLLVNMGCIVFADLYFLYFIKFIEENNRLKLKLILLEQQSTLQYEYYVSQEEKYNESVRILHDVDKHIRLIEEMHGMNENEMALSYTREISQLLTPLAVKEYTNHPILNILLNDKERCALYHNIDFKAEIGEADLHFMKPMEITTLFGNLLDNAIESCDKVIIPKFIEMKIDTYHNFIAIHIKNSTVEIDRWSNGKPVSQKGKEHGIGLVNVENVIKKYNGNMILEADKGIFSCNIILNG